MTVPIVSKISANLRLNEYVEHAVAAGRSVIPIGLDKRPFFSLLPRDPETNKATWKPFQTQHPTPEELARWIHANPPAFAIATGELSGVVTFDFDGAEGVALAAAWGIRPHRRTGSGGLHWDVRWPGFYVPTLNRKAVRALKERWPGLDVKGDGGYVVFCGRSHYGEYLWLRDQNPDDPRLVSAQVWRYLHSRTAADLSNFETIEADNRGENSGGHCYGDRVDCEILIRQALRDVPSGRNNAGFGLALQCRDNGYSRSETREVLRQFRARCPKTNTKGIAEPYSDGEINGTVDSVFSQAARAPWAKRGAMHSGGTAAGAAERGL